MRENRPVIALDFPTFEDVKAFLAKFPTDEKLYVKIGMELYYAAGPEIVRYVKEHGHSVFLDLKLHDIPNTVARAVRSAADLGVWMVDLHASGGLRMMEEAKRILEPYGKDAPLLIAVTVLTSMEDLDLLQIGINASPMEQVLRLAHLTQRAGLDGVVCSPQEVEILRNACGEEFKLVTPGIRPIGADFGDQRRVMTPTAAIRAGSDYLVVGRPITKADNPAEVLRSINASIG